MGADPPRSTRAASGERLGHLSGSWGMTWRPLDGRRPMTHPLPGAPRSVRGPTGTPPAFGYRYRLDGDRTLPDPASRFQPEGVHGPSEVIDPRAFAWTDPGWMGTSLQH